jgi:metal-sulfur cluster biosynthetic enzyme
VTARSRGAASVDAAVWAALADVFDPELDEPVTELGFVASCDVDEDGTVEVHLRLPTYFCAANFAYLILSDARDALYQVPGVRRALVVLDEHFTGTAINAGVAEGRGFVEIFGDEAAEGLEPLRRDFLRKAVLAATDRVRLALASIGEGPERLASLTLGDVADVAGGARLRDRRARLGLPAGDGDALVVDPDSGEPVLPAALPHHLRRARLARVSLEANGELCRGLLRERERGRETAVTIHSAGA